MTAEPDDIAALRADDDLVEYLLSLTVAPPPKLALVEPEAPTEPEYFIPHRGAWPIGTAASGPTPMNGRCSCPKCNRGGA